MKSLALFLVLHLPAFAQGPLTPPGAPAPTQHSLQEIWSELQSLKAQNQALVDSIGALPAAPNGFALIPGGVFMMGEDAPNTTAVLHQVQVDSFYMAIHETTKEEWDSVKVWGEQHGYYFGGPGAGKAANHPVQSVSWHDAILWCNAKSEMEGLTPCYWVAKTPFRAGTNDDVLCNWKCNGYRLPTEAEWEKACRGGYEQQNFSWGNQITHNFANFNNSSAEPYQSGTTGFHPYWTGGGPPYTNAVGLLLGAFYGPNNYGLYDVEGNVSEWCYDRYSEEYYTSSGAGYNPRGVLEGLSRVVRGGNWNWSAYFARCQSRLGRPPTARETFIGFRLAKSR